MSIFLIIIMLALLYLAYYATTKKFNYFKNKEVPHLKPWPLFGNYAQFILLQKSSYEVIQEICKKFKNEPYFGSYYGTEPALVILDPDIIKLVFKKDFYYFNSREHMDYSNRETITKGIFFESGDKWKLLRSNLTPLFSSAKLKKMFILIEKCSFSLEDMFDRETEVTDVIGAKSLMVRYTMDCISSCAFGIDCKTMDNNYQNNSFSKMGDIIISKSYLRGAFWIFRQIWPNLFYGIGLKYFPKIIDNFFHELITGVFGSRNYEPTDRNDFIDLLLILMKNKTIVGDRMSNLKTGETEKIKLELDDKLLIAQCVIIFGGGFETSASTLSLTIHELAKNQAAQKRPQEEVDEYLKRNNNKISDNCITELPYLDACVSETLRLYPLFGIITREVVEGYTFPSGLHIEKGTRVHLPVIHLHNDPKFFPEPEEYKPERFLPDAEHEIKPYTYFPFGDGPRKCLGARFSKLQILPGLITFLKTFSAELAPGAPREVQLEPTTILLHPVGTLPVRVTRRPGWKTRMYDRNEYKDQINNE